jgi:hypothetical protein
VVNAGMVNGPTSCFKRATFCVFFPLLGRFPRLKNPVKYARNFNINHETVHSAQERGTGCLQKPLLSQWLIQPLRLPEGASAIIISVKKKPAIAQKRTGKPENALE